MRRITAADYLVEFWIANGVTDVYGYQGGMVCHIFDSLGMYRDRIRYHNCGSEQGAAFAACGYAQSTGRLGVILTTSGPGFTNAVTGLANAYFDSLPVMLVSGQVNTKDKRRDYTFRQYGFQEIQAVEIARPIVKKVYEVDVDTDIPACLQDAYRTAMEGRKGPVYIDFPINSGREVVDASDSLTPVPAGVPMSFDAAPYVDMLMKAERPLILAGAGISQCGMREEFRELIALLQVPVALTMPGTDLLPTDCPCRVGFFGGTARREAGIVMRQADCVLSLGTRLCNKAIGYHHEDFIPKAKTFFRVELDVRELERQIKECEEDVVADLRSFLPSALKHAREKVGAYDHGDWLGRIQGMKNLLADQDITFGNELVQKFTELLPEQANITLDVGNNLVYGEQSAVVKAETRIFASAGLGSMGYAIPAAIGAAAEGVPTYAITGDGGAQMNVQELNTIAKMGLPVKILVLNNRALGHIILFQEHYLENRLVATAEKEGDYYSCDFAALARAYGIRGRKIHRVEELEALGGELRDGEPLLIEAEYENCTMLPNIHGGLDPLANGPALPEDLVKKVRELMEVRE